jgi:hypothetical protein
VKKWMVAPSTSSGQAVEKGGHEMREDTSPWKEEAWMRYAHCSICFSHETEEAENPIKSRQK